MGSSRPRKFTRPGRSRPVPSKLSRPPLASQLAEIAGLLGSAYSACVTVQQALEGQNAEQDADFARCLRLSVADPVSKVASELRGIAAGWARR